MTSVYVKAPNIRIREVPESEGALIYTPETPNIVFVNDPTLLVLEFIDSISVDQAKDEYVSYMDELGWSEIEDVFDQAVDLLVRSNVLVVINTQP